MYSECSRHKIYCCTTIYATQPKKIISVTILFTLFVLMSIYLNLLCPTYIDIFYPHGKYVSITFEKGTI